jgi:hypothetical protein
MQERLVSTRSLRCGRAIAALLLFVLAPAFQPAQAQEQAQNSMTNAGQFEGENGSVLFFATDNTQKLTGLDLRTQNSDEHYQFNGTYKDLQVFFSTADDWREFVSLWEKARSSREATNTDGVFFDGATGRTLLAVDKERNGDIWFTMSANPDANNIPRDTSFFTLTPKDFAAFGKTVKKITVYFGK